MKRTYLIPLLALAVGASYHAAAQQGSHPSRSLPSYLAPMAIAPPVVRLPGNESFGGAVSSVANDPTLPARLQAALDKAYMAIDSRVRHGVQVSVIAPGLGQWNSAAGLSDSIAPVTNAMHFEIGSISKTFVAAVIFQLIEEGKLALDDSLGRWITPRANIDGAVTIRQLLNHSSGIYDYVNDDPTGAVLNDAYIDNPGKQWSYDDILGYVGASNFKPGSNTRYSNTNYVLLAMIIEKITGHTYPSEVRRRLLDPLNLKNTYVAWSETVPGLYADGWSIGFDPVKQTDIGSIPTTAPLSSINAAGGMVSTAEDMAQWANALYHGTVLSRRSLDTMLKFKSTSIGELGLGAFRYHYYTKLAYGHTGGVLGYESWMFSIPTDSIAVGILINSFDTQIDVGSNAIGTALLAELYKPASGVAADEARALALGGCYPNPARDEATIDYSTPLAGHVRIDLLDLNGRTVATVVDEALDAGSHSATMRLAGLPSGTYFYALHTAAGTLVKSLQVVN